jgi:hypothetical protein
MWQCAKISVMKESKSAKISEENRKMSGVAASTARKNVASRALAWQKRQCGSGSGNGWQASRAAARHMAAAAKTKTCARCKRKTLAK